MKEGINRSQVLIRVDSPEVASALKIVGKSVLVDMVSGEDRYPPARLVGMVRDFQEGFFVVEGPGGRRPAKSIMVDLDALGGLCIGDVVGLTDPCTETIERSFVVQKAQDSTRLVVAPETGMSYEEDLHEWLRRNSGHLVFLKVSQEKQFPFKN